MKIVDELNKLLPDLNSKQVEFIEHYGSVFLNIEGRILSPNSQVNVQKEYLVIFLEHISDPNTWLEFKVERREIYITVAGFGYSMLLVADKDSKEYQEDVLEFITLALNGDFKKVVYRNSTGEIIKESLYWH